jgi:hypothetical protein
VRGLLLLATTLLASCHATIEKPLTQLKLVDTKPPLTAFDCRDEPVAPKAPATKGQTMAYAIDAIGAYRDCRGHLEGVRRMYYPDGTPAGGDQGGS